MSSKRKVLVLGAGGFIGRNLAEKLNCLGDSVKPERFQIIRCGHKKFIPHGISCNLCDPHDVTRTFELVQPDIVIHAAAVTTGSKDVLQRPHLHVTDNAVMNSLVLRACHDFRVNHCIFLSCTVMYQPNEKPQAEHDWNPADPIYPAYFGVGNMKVFTERMCEFYSRLGYCKFTAIRHSNVYGPYDKYDLDRSHVYGAMMTKIMSSDSGRKAIKILGEGRAKRDLIYVDDLIDFIDRTIVYQQTPYELYNCGLGVAISIKDMIDIIAHEAGFKVTLEYDKSRPEIPTTVVLDCSKAQKELGWRAAHSLTSGTKKTLAWYKETYPNGI